MESLIVAKLESCYGLRQGIHALGFILGVVPVAHMKHG